MHFFIWSSRPDGEKKAYVRLAPDYDALDVANKVSFKLLLYYIYIYYYLYIIILLFIYFMCKSFTWRGNSDALHGIRKFIDFLTITSGYSLCYKFDNIAKILLLLNVTY